jgi:hypothetical protein
MTATRVSPGPISFGMPIFTVCLHSGVEPFGKAMITERRNLKITTKDLSRKQKSLSRNGEMLPNGHELLASPVWLNLATVLFTLGAR